VGSWSDDELSCTVGRIDLYGQVIETIRIDIGTGAPHVLRNRLRYLWPTELDLLAEKAGLHLTERHQDFHEQPMDPASTNHVSVYRKS
jgi:hypothetical protein